MSSSDPSRSGGGVCPLFDLLNNSDLYEDQADEQQSSDSAILAFETPSPPVSTVTCYGEEQMDLDFIVSSTPSSTVPPSHAGNTWKPISVDDLVSNSVPDQSRVARAPSENVPRSNCSKQLLGSHQACFPKPVITCSKPATTSLNPVTTTSSGYSSESPENLSPIALFEIHSSSNHIGQEDVYNADADVSAEILSPAVLKDQATAKSVTNNRHMNCGATTDSSHAQSTCQRNNTSKSANVLPSSKTLGSCCSSLPKDDNLICLDSDSDAVEEYFLHHSSSSNSPTSAPTITQNATVPVPADPVPDDDNSLLSNSFAAVGSRGDPISSSRFVAGIRGGPTASTFGSRGGPTGLASVFPSTTETEMRNNVQRVRPIPLNSGRSRQQARECAQTTTNNTNSNNSNWPHHHRRVAAANDYVSEEMLFTDDAHQSRNSVTSRDTISANQRGAIRPGRLRGLTSRSNNSSAVQRILNELSEREFTAANASSAPSNERSSSSSPEEYALHHHHHHNRLPGHHHRHCGQHLCRSSAAAACNTLTESSPRSCRSAACHCCTATPPPQSQSQCSGYALMPSSRNNKSLIAAAANESSCSSTTTSEDECGVGELQSTIKFEALLQQRYSQHSPITLTPRSQFRPINAPLAASAGYRLSRSTRSTNMPRQGQPQQSTSTSTDQPGPSSSRNRVSPQMKKLKKCPSNVVRQQRGSRRATTRDGSFEDADEVIINYSNLEIDTSPSAVTGSTFSFAAGASATSQALDVTTTTASLDVAVGNALTDAGSSENSNDCDWATASSGNADEMLFDDQQLATGGAAMGEEDSFASPSVGNQTTDQIRQMEEDEALARRLQQEFDAEIAQQLAAAEPQQRRGRVNFVEPGSLPVPEESRRSLPRFVETDPEDLPDDSRISHFMSWTSTGRPLVAYVNDSSEEEDTDYHTFMRQLPSHNRAQQSSGSSINKSRTVVSSSARQQPVTNAEAAESSQLGVRRRLRSANQNAGSSSSRDGRGQAPASLHQRFGFLQARGSDGNPVDRISDATSAVYHISHVDYDDVVDADASEPATVEEEQEQPPMTLRRYLSMRTPSTARGRSSVAAAAAALSAEAEDAEPLSAMLRRGRPAARTYTNNSAASAVEELFMANDDSSNNGDQRSAGVTNSDLANSSNLSALHRRYLTSVGEQAVGRRQRQPIRTADAGRQPVSGALDRPGRPIRTAAVEDCGETVESHNRQAASVLSHWRQFCPTSSSRPSRRPAAITTTSHAVEDAAESGTTGQEEAAAARFSSSDAGESEVDNVAARQLNLRIGPTGVRNFTSSVVSRRGAANNSESALTSDTARQPIVRLRPLSFTARQGTSDDGHAWTVTARSERAQPGFSLEAETNTSTSSGVGRPQRNTRRPPPSGRAAGASAGFVISNLTSGLGPTSAAGVRAARDTSRRGVNSSVRMRIFAPYVNVMRMGMAGQEGDYEELLDLAEFLGDATPHLSPAQIRRLPVCTFKAARSSTSSDNGFDDPSCRICICDYEDGEEQRVLPCFHKFHSSCIDQWLKRKVSCPICRVDVRLTDPNQE